MIKFFRNIRQNLLNEGKTTQYLTYAVGEIILVVVGILIALQINNWNEDQKAKASTLTYINSMIGDLKKDTLMYANQIKDTEMKFRFCKDIKDQINGNKALIDTSAFIVNLQAAGRLLIPLMNRDTYKDLISTGNMKLIDDEKSIDAIRKYYNNEAEWWYTDYKNQLVNGYLPLVVDAIPLHLHEEILGREMGVPIEDSYDAALFDNKVEHFTKEDVTEIMNALKGNKAFAFQLKRISRSHLVQIKFLGLAYGDAKSLLEVLGEWKTKNAY